MARRIKVTEIKGFYEGLIVDAVAGTTLEWTRRVKKATPVDTGRLRSAWQTNIKRFEGNINNNWDICEKDLIKNNIMKKRIFFKDIPVCYMNSKKATNFIIEKLSYDNDYLVEK